MYKKEERKGKEGRGEDYKFTALIQTTERF
jgi:hypothetical protein